MFLVTWASECHRRRSLSRFSKVKSLEGRPPPEAHPDADRPRVDYNKNDPKLLYRKWIISAKIGEIYHMGIIFTH